MHILIAEDQRKMAVSLKRSLEEENHSVGIALDGHDALEMAQALEYDAIVLNVMLPRIDGFEVMRRLRKAGKPDPDPGPQFPQYGVGHCERSGDWGGRLRHKAILL